MPIEDQDPTARPPAIPGMTLDEDSIIRGDTPDEPVEDDDADDVSAPFDEEDETIGVEDDDTVGVNDADDDERA